MIETPQGRPPFRADHIGSLLRPQVLRKAFREHANKGIDDAAFARVQDECIADVVKMQTDVGLKVVTDGEFRRGSYWGRFVERVEGFSIKNATLKFRDDQGHQIDFTAPYASGKLKRDKPLALDEFEFLKGIAKVTPKITLPAPSTMHFFRPADFADKAAYADEASFFAALNHIYREEIAQLTRAGCKYIQLDEVAIALLCDPAICKQVEAMGLKPDDLVDLYIETINESVKGAPADVAFGVHMCRGNFKGHYIGSGGYAPVAERFFANTKVNHFLLEYDTERAGDFRPLRFVRGKGVVLGLISSKTPVLESLDDLKRRTEEAAQYVDLDRLAISPQCGFASSVAGNPVTESDERKKLELEVRAARMIWGE